MLTMTADLRHGLAENLPFEDHVFDKAFAINSMQSWLDAIAGLREIGRDLRGGARIALEVTPYSGQEKPDWCETFTAASFTDPQVVEGDKGFGAIATKPNE